MKKRFQPVILAVIQKGDKYLLTKRVQDDPEDEPDFHDKWQIPGGGLEFGEEVEACLHREVREELGIEVEIVSLLPVFYTRVKGNWNGIFITYICRMKDEAAPIVINDEASDYGWYSLEEMKKLEMLPGTVILFEDISGRERS